jgi:prepilin-type processing-associated H-X9-DG protein
MLNWGRGWWLNARHGGKDNDGLPRDMNILFGDGHVKMVNRDNIVNDALRASDGATPKGDRARLFWGT